MEIRQAISMYLKAYVMDNPEFKGKFENPNKNLDECLLFIQYKMLEKVTEEQKKNQAAVIIPSDDEIFALAVEYYDNEDLKVEGARFDSVKIVSYAATSFTDEEKKKMREEAIKQYQEQVIAEQRKKDNVNKNKGKDKKPTQPVMVPDVPAKKSEEPTKKEEKPEDKKPKVVQMDIFGEF